MTFEDFNLKTTKGNLIDKSGNSKMDCYESSDDKSSESSLEIPSNVLQSDEKKIRTENNVISPDKSANNYQTEVEENRDEKQKKKRRPKCQFVITGLEKFFYWYGKQVARRPFLVAFIAIVLCATLSVGLITFREEGNPFKLWIPQDSDFVKNTNWLWQNFPPDSRFHSVILEAENVLEPSILKHMLKIHNAVSGIKLENGETWVTQCYPLPVIDLEFAGQTDSDDDFVDFTSFDDFYYYEYVDEPVSATPQTGLDSTLTGLDPTFIENGSNKAIERRRRRRRRRRRDATLEEEKGNDTSAVDPSIDLYPMDYCEIVSKITRSECYETSLLEMWAEDQYGEKTAEIVEKLTLQDVINAINNDTYFSQIFRRSTDFTEYLGGVERNASGHIVGARATFVRFLGRINNTDVDQDEIGERKSSLGQPVDATTLEFEAALLEALESPDLHSNPDISLKVNVARSFDDLSEDVINADVTWFIIGVATLYIYVQLNLGKFNFVEQRPLLSLLGIGIIHVALFVSFGICLPFGLPFSPMHNIIPFLLLGIGIDDMFVICQSLDNLMPTFEARWRHRRDVDGAASEATKEEDIEELIGQTMKHAGVAITVTSVTDVIVFAIGATTVLPALRSFCVFCAVGILLVYALQTSVFVAALAKDVKRVEERRNGFLVCYQHSPDWTPNKFSRKNFLQTGFEKFYAPVLVTKWAKVFVLLLTAALAGFGVWGCVNLRQEFNPVWFLPPGSNLKQWFEANEKFFPSEGERVTINIGDIDYSKELVKVEKLVEKLQNETEIVSKVESWFTEFKEYIEGNGLVLDEDFFSTFRFNNTEFYFRLTQFLFSPVGAKFRTNFRFDSDIICGENSPIPKLSTIQFTHKLFSGPSEHVPAMNKIKSIVASVNFSSRAFAVANEYAGWETDEIISVETVRNLVLSLVCVFLTTLALIQDLRAVILVLASVLLTMVDVTGFMHFWGLTIDVVSCINLVIAVGLSVDYSAHIAHYFMVCEGTRNERTVQSLRNIGPAVLNGGFSTFLAFVFTASSQSHVFLTFFKIFFLVVVFGLFHGLVFLPVALSLFGPLNHEEEAEDQDFEGQELPKAEFKDKSRRWSVISAQFAPKNEGASTYSPSLAANRNPEDTYKKAAAPVTVISLKTLRDNEEFGVDNPSFKEP